MPALVLAFFLLCAGGAECQSSPAQWTPLGPAAVLSPDFGLVSGRITSLALDPSDPSGNRLYVGSLAGGVWVTQNANAADAASITFTPLTDSLLDSLLNPSDPSQAADVYTSIRIGALSVEPGVILAGTGDPNDPGDLYFGLGILLSTDNGQTWTLNQKSSDLMSGLSDMDYGFVGEAIAGFAWSTNNPPVVVAAVTQTDEASLVGAEWADYSYAGLYYSTDTGATWHLALITDGNGRDVQGPLSAFAQPDGSAATSVVWNQARGVFVAAVRFHGYYASPDGKVWTRLAAQPGAGLTVQNCPSNLGMRGSSACPIWRGTLAVDPGTGDTLAWTVDENNQDQGLWRDACIPAGACAAGAFAFGQQIDTTPLQTNTEVGSSTIANGNYNFALAAIPSAGGTVLLAGADDLWRCMLTPQGSCAWRNTTSSGTCRSAQVGAHLHALEWTPDASVVFIGNDSGLWRSADAMGGTDPACSAADASHFQNLNGGFGSLAEVASISSAGTSSAILAGLGENGTVAAGDAAADWPEILDGYGGPVASGPGNPANWYVNNGRGVSIHACTDVPACTIADFGTAPVVSDADVGGDGSAMKRSAPFLVDPADSSQLLIGTCRVWRGPADGAGWTAVNAISPVLDQNDAGQECAGQALIRSIAAMALPGGGEVVYAGTYGALDGGASLPGHVFGATQNADGSWPAWNDLTLNPVSNDSRAMNTDGLDIASLFLDPSDETGNTVYATLAGFPTQQQGGGAVYRSADGGAHWTLVSSGLPFAPVNGLAVDPADPNTVYVATALGVYSTRHIGWCGSAGTSCWSAYGAGLPGSPVAALVIAASASGESALVAGTGGRGIWQASLWTAGTQLTAVSASLDLLAFGSQPQNTSSSPLTVTITNVGTSAFLPTSVSASGDFHETDHCAGAVIAPQAGCAVQVTFAPTRLGDQTGSLTVVGNVAGGSLVIPLEGTGSPPPAVFMNPAAQDFGQVEVGTTSPALEVTVENSGAMAVPITRLTVTAPFLLAGNACGTTTLAPETDCQMTVQFAPAAAGPATGTLTLVDAAGTQTVQLSGTGTRPSTDLLSPGSLAFPETIVGEQSAAQTVTLSNSGDNPLTSISVVSGGPFHVSSNCTTQLAADSSCALQVVYVPSAPGTETGTLTVSDILRTQSVPLSGAGVMPAALAVSPPSLSFSGQPVGQASPPASFSVINGGATPATGIAIRIEGPSASSFSLVANTCAATLAAGSTCAVQVSFSPAASGAAAAALVVASSASGASPVAVPLSGTGYVFDFTATLSGSASQTVARGQSAFYTFLLVPSGGVSADFSFQCNGLPKYASCVFNPADNSVAGNATGTETVQIATGPSSASARRAYFPAGLRLALACCLFVIPAALRGLRRALWLLVLALLAAGSPGCTSSGGGGGAAPSDPTSLANTTAAGTYAVPVVVSAKGVQHTVTLTLVVE